MIKLPLVEAYVGADGDRITVTWGGILDPKGWTDFNRDPTKFATGKLSTFTNPKGSNRLASDTTQATDSLVRYEVIGGLLYVSTFFSFMSSTKRLWEGEQATITIDEGIITNIDGTIITTGLVAAPLSTNRINIIPHTSLITGIKSFNHLWIDAGRSETSGAIAGNITAVTDFSGYTNHLSAVPGKTTSFVAGKSSGSRFGSNRARISFAGSGVLSAASSSLNTTGNLTLSVSIKCDDITDRYIISKRNASDNLSYWFRVVGGVYKFGISPDGTSSTEYDLGAPSVGQTELITIWKEGARIEAFRNGRYQLISTNASPSIFAGTAQFVVGAKTTSDSVGLFKGTIGEISFYPTAISEGPLSSLLAGMSVRWDVELVGPPLPLTQLQHIERRPIAEINCFGANYNKDPLTGQASWWYDTGNRTVQDLQGKLQDFIDDIVSLLKEYDIMIRLPGGSVAGCIMSSYPWSYMTPNQVQAIINIANDPKNNFGFGPTKRRLWFYSGTGYCYDVVNDVLSHNAPVGSKQGGGRFMNGREQISTKPEKWFSNVLGSFTNKHPLFASVFCDAASTERAKFVEIVHSPEAQNAKASLIGEAIPEETDMQLSAAWGCVVGFSSAPWWKKDTVQPGYDYRNGYNKNWSVDYEKTRIFFIVADSEILQTEDGFVPAGTGISYSGLTRDGLKEFILKGGIPITKGSNTATVASIWKELYYPKPINGWWYQNFIVNRD